MQIINEIEGGKSKSDVSRQMGLASSTVATIWKNRENIVSAYGNGSDDKTSDDPLARLKECLPPETVASPMVGSDECCWCRGLTSCYMLLTSFVYIYVWVLD